jgi:hypothetical protein
MFVDQKLRRGDLVVEGTLVLCDCPADWTGGVHVSLDLLDAPLASSF